MHGNSRSAVPRSAGCAGNPLFRVSACADPRAPSSRSGGWGSACGPNLNARRGALPPGPFPGAATAKRRRRDVCGDRRAVPGGAARGRGGAGPAGAGGDNRPGRAASRSLCQRVSLPSLLRALTHRKARFHSHTCTDPFFFFPKTTNPIALNLFTVIHNNHNSSITFYVMCLICILRYYGI